MDIHQPSKRPKDGAEIIADYKNGRFVRLSEASMIEAKEVALARKALALGQDAVVAFLLGKEEEEVLD